MKITNEEMHFVTKTWGWERWIVNNDQYCGKILCIEKDKFCSFHFHKVKDEVLFCQDGTIAICYDEGNGQKLELLYPGEAFHVAPGTIHQMYALETTYIHEFSTHHEDSDSYRVSTDLQFSKEELSNLLAT
jgi:mannose-6-phosphate isomerase-like protein (cupin superfamily)